VTVQVLPGTWGGLLLGGVILGLLTLGGYLLNNLAVQRVGAAWTAILSASGNALTALAAWILIQESLAGGQWLGIGLVTLGVTLLSVEQLSKPRRSPRSRQSPPS
jgi:drug/metabolite transporter (DMT)-like permease